ncbi:MAG: hypothetical protein U0X76_05665 [Bacteroidia bacterium]
MIPVTFDHLKSTVVHRTIKVEWKLTTAPPSYDERHFAASPLRHSPKANLVSYYGRIFE